MELVQTALEATFCGLMTDKSQTDQECKVFMLKSSQIGNLFKLTIGRERVSPEGVVDNIIEKGEWNGHAVTGLQLLEENRDSLSQSQLLHYLECIGFITQALLAVEKKPVS